MQPLPLEPVSQNTGMQRKLRRESKEGPGSEKKRVSGACEKGTLHGWEREREGGYEE